MEIMCGPSRSSQEPQIRYIGSTSDTVRDERAPDDPEEQEVYLYSGICEAQNKMIYAFPYSAMNLAEIQPDMGIIRDIPLHSVLEPNRSRFFEFCKPLADGNIFSARSEDDVQFWIMQYQPPRSSILGLANHIRNLADPNSEFNEHWDVEINVTSSSGETKIFRGHKALLARYDYFKAMLSSNFSEGISGRVEINDTSPAAFQVLWDSFYCKPTTASIQKLNCLEVLDAMELSVRFGVNNLRAALSDQLISMSFMTMSAPMLPAMLKACSTFELRKLEMVFSLFTLKSSTYRPTRSHKILFPIMTFFDDDEYRC
jgi:hypothetical protein